MISTDNFVAQPYTFVKLRDFSTDDTGALSGKKEGKKIRKNHIKKLRSLQDQLYAQKRYAVLLIFQGMDASGKDSTIKHVMSGINPQGCKVNSFIAPNSLELQHDFLWRAFKVFPEKGRIGIFNRSYYEEVITTKVHPHFILKQKLPGIYRREDITPQFWENRHRSINEMEHHLYSNGTLILKFYLHLSKKEQKNRFMKRIHREDKNWKFSMSDIEERAHWNHYQEVFENVINHTSTKHAPWYIIPADHKWYMRTLVSHILVEKLEELHLHYPKVTVQQMENIDKARRVLENEA